MSIEEVTTLVEDYGLPHREEGWFDKDEIRETSPQLSRLSINGLINRLKRLVEDGILETKLVYDTKRKNKIRVYRVKKVS